jgi:hypothetical protein
MGVSVYSTVANTRTVDNYQPRYVATRGYWATTTKSVYDVVVEAGGVEVAVVGFIDESQTDGALYWQIPRLERKYRDEDAIRDTARSFARSATGWRL